jgi:hypothetical protein
LTRSRRRHGRLPISVSPPALGHVCSESFRSSCVFARRIHATRAARSASAVATRAAPRTARAPSHRAHPGRSRIRGTPYPASSNIATISSWENPEVLVPHLPPVLVPVVPVHVDHQRHPPAPLARQRPRDLAQRVLGLVHVVQHQEAARRVHRPVIERQQLDRALTELDRSRTSSPPLPRRRPASSRDWIDRDHPTHAPREQLRGVPRPAPDVRDRPTGVDQAEQTEGRDPLPEQLVADRVPLAPTRPKNDRLSVFRSASTPARRRSSSFVSAPASICDRTTTHTELASWPRGRRASGCDRSPSRTAASPASPPCPACSGAGSPCSAAAGTCSRPRPPPAPASRAGAASAAGPCR